MKTHYLSKYPYQQRDLTSNEQNLSILTMATELLSDSSIDILELETELCQDAEFVSKANPLLLEAINIASSKHLLNQCVTPFHVTIVWAMYNETSRLKTKAENEHGEDALRVKMAQLNWLFKDLNPNCSWNIIACDDGCPETPSSSEFCNQIITEEGYQDRVQIIKLQDAIDNQTPVSPYFAQIKSTSDSRKGGSILLSMWHAIHRNQKELSDETKHVVVFTDADLSANLSQIGKLAYPIIQEQKSCTLGQRYGLKGSILVLENGAVTEPESTGKKTGKLLVLFRHFVRVCLIPSLAKILDTQAGFKAFDAQHLKKIIPNIQAFEELFDIDLLVNMVQNEGPDSLAIAPILFVEDFALTNFPSLKPGEGHLNMIQQIISTYERSVAQHTPADAAMLAFFKSLDLDRFVHLIAQLEAEDEGNPTLFDRRWTLEQLQAFMKLEKSA